MIFIKNIKQRIKKTILFNIYKRLIVYKRDVTSSLVFLRSSYVISNIINSIVTPFYTFRKKYRRESMKGWNNIKKIMLVHSKMHFDPYNDHPERDFYYSGTASTARNIWDLFSDKERIHIDIKERSNIINKQLDGMPKVDIIIGLMSNNFIACARRNPDAKKILLLVNCHPLFRANALLSEAKKLNKRIPAAEWVNPNILTRLRFYTDAILLVGNDVIRDTYLKYDLNDIPIFPINLGINKDILYPIPESRPRDKIRFVYPASQMGIRKGLFRMIESWTILNNLVPQNSIELFLIGDSSLFSKEIEIFLSKFSNVTNLGWLDYMSQLPYLQSSHVVLGPSIEEGQVSWVLEAMACGCIPIITPECGIDLVHGAEGFLIKDYTNANEIAEYMKKIVNDVILRKQLSSAVLDLIEKKHKWDYFKSNLRKILE